MICALLDSVRDRAIVPALPMLRALGFLLLVGLTGSALHASSVRELAPGLVLVRVHTLTEPLPDVEGTEILDLRYVRADAEGEPTSLRQRLQEPGPLRLVLYDNAPPEALVSLLNQRQPKVVTLAPKGAQLAPDVAVTLDRQADRAAYEALEGGTALSALVDATVSKDRFDEAALVRARSRTGDRRTSDAATAAKDDTEAKPEPRDTLLQHAVRLARGLEALGRG